MPTKTKRQRRVVPYNVAQAEIEAIKEKMNYVELAARKTLPTAIEIGDWFARQRAKMGNIGWDDWEGWVQSKFPNTALRTVHVYVQLASEKQFLSAKFTAVAAVGESDFQTLPTIKEALKAITEKNAPIRKGAGRVPRAPKTVDVQSEVSPISNNGSAAAERGIRFFEPETAVKAAAEGIPIEHPDAPLTPMEEINAELSKCASCLRTAMIFWQRAVVIAQHHQIPIAKMKTELHAHLDDDVPGLAACFTALKVVRALKVHPIVEA